MNIFEVSAKLSMDTSGFIKGIKTVQETKSGISNFFQKISGAADTAKNGISVFGDVLKANLASELIEKGAEKIVEGFQKMGAAATNFVKDSVSVGETFDSAMSQVFATMGDKASEAVEYNGEMMQSTEALRKFAKEMGATTKFSATESAQALNYMALAGYNAETSMKMLPNVMNLASAGAFDLARASDMLTDTQTAFGISLERTNQMVDEMAAAASNSNTSVAQLGDAFLTVGGLAKELNGGFVTLSNGTTATVDGVQELEIALGAMANAGIKGSEAGTHMRNLLMKLSSPTDDAKKLFEDLGISVFDASGNMKSLRDVFREMQDAFAGMNNQQKKLEAISEIFNARDTASATALLAAVEQSWDSLGEAILNADGAAAKMAETQLNNLAGAKTIMKSALEGLQINISDAVNPFITPFVKFAGESLQAFSNTIEKEGIANLRGTIAKVMTNAGVLVYKNVPKFLKNLVKVLTIIKNGIADGLPSFMDSARATIATIAQDMEKELPEFIKAGQRITAELGNGIIRNRTYLIRAISKVARAISKSISSNLPVIIPAVTSGVLTIIDELTKPERITDFVDAGIELAVGLAEGIGKSASIVIEKMPEIVENLKQGFSDNKDRLKETADTILSAITDGIGELSFSDTVNSIVSGLGTALDSEEWKTVKEKISNGIQNIDFSEITSNLSKLIIGVTDSAGKLIDGIDWSVVGGAIGEALNGVDWYGVLDKAFGLIVTTIKQSPELVKGLAETIDSETATQLATIGINLLVGKKIVGGIASYISSTTAFTTVSTALSGLFTKLAPAVGAFIIGWDIGTKIRNEIDDIELFDESFNEVIDRARDNVARLRAGIEAVLSLQIGSNYNSAYEKNYKNIIHAMYETGKGFASKKYNDSYMSWIEDYNAEKFAEAESLDIDFDDVLSGLDTSLTDYIEYYKSSGAYLWGQTFSDNFAGGISDNSNKVTDSIDAMAQEIADRTEHHSPAQKGVLSNDDTWMPNMMKMFADGIKANIPLITTQIETLTEKLKSLFANSTDELKNLWSDFWKNFNGRAKTGTNDFNSTAQAIPNNFREISSNSWTWGSDMIDNFISGINQKWNDAVNTVANFAEMIASYIGFSEPEKGALSRFHTFAPDMIELFAEGIKQNQNLVMRQAETLAENLSSTFQKPIMPVIETAFNESPEISEYHLPELPDLSLNADTSIIDKIKEVLENPLFLSVRLADGFENIRDMFTAESLAMPEMDTVRRYNDNYISYQGSNGMQSMYRNSYTTIQEMTVSVPGININSDSDMDTLADILVERLAERLDSKSIYDSRGTGGTGVWA